MKLEAALQQLEIGRKAKQLQNLWPTIEAKLAEGVSHAEILGLLNDNGFDLTERTYSAGAGVQRLHVDGKAAHQNL